MAAGCVGDMVDLGITESFQVKRQVLLSASEAAEMVLRVDDILKAAPRYDVMMISSGIHHQLNLQVSEKGIKMLMHISSFACSQTW